MEGQPIADQQALIHDAIASGRMHRPEDAVAQALCFGKSVK